MSELHDRIVSIVRKVSPAASVQEQSDYNRPLADIGVDSLDTMSILLEVQESLGMTIPDEDVDALESINDIADYVQKKR